MIGQRWLAAFVLAALTAAGCDQREQGPATQTPPRAALPSTAPAVVAHAPATQPDTAPAVVAAPGSSSTLLIDGRLVQFPGARLRLNHADGNINAVLFTADPKNAIDSDYIGNSFYLVMPLQITDPQALATAEWVCRATGDEERNTTEGIFLHGLRAHYQPSDVRVTFAGTVGLVQVQLAGQFLAFDSAVPGPPRLANVTGSIIAMLVETK